MKGERNMVVVTTGSNTANPAGSPRVADSTVRPDGERVSLAPLDPVTALKGLLATNPPTVADR